MSVRGLGPGEPVGHVGRGCGKVESVAYRPRGAIVRGQWVDGDGHRRLRLSSTRRRVRIRTLGLTANERTIKLLIARQREAALDIKEEQVLGGSVESHWYYRSKAMVLRQVLRGIDFHKVLDIGAGSGVFSKILVKQHGVEAICVDPAYEQETRTEMVAGRPVRFVRKVPPNGADLVLLMDVLEHVDDDVALLREAVRGAAPRAHVLVSVPAFQSLFSAHDRFLGHRRRYTLRQIEATVAKSGLEVLRSRYFFAFLLPVATAVRVLQRSDIPKSNLRRHSAPINALFVLLHKLELGLSRGNRLGGLSVFCLARKLQ